MATKQTADTSTLTVGSKYDPNQTTLETCKAIRRDIAAAKKSGKLSKELRISVRKSEYSMGCSITLTIKALPAGFRWFGPCNKMTATPEAERLLHQLRNLANAYNRQHVDAMTDYSNVAFYLHVGLDHDLRQGLVAAFQRGE
jgi:hypothetical protein